MKFHTTAKIGFMIFFSLFVLCQNGFAQNTTAYLYPTATEVCIGNSLAMKIRLTGTAPFQVSYKENRSGIITTLPPIQTQDLVSGEYTFYVTPLQVTSYSIVSFRDANRSGFAFSSLQSVHQVYPLATRPELSSKLICPGKPLTFSTRVVGCGSIDWQYSDDNGATYTSFNNAPTETTYTTTALTSADGIRKTYLIRARVYNVGPGGTFQNFTLSEPVEVLPKPIAGTITSDITEVCAGSTVNLSIAGYYGEVVWQRSLDGLNFSDTDVTGPSGSFTVYRTSYFRAKVYVNRCSLLPVYTNIIRVEAETFTRSYISASPSSFLCTGSSTTLTLSTYGGGTIQWMMSTDGTNFTNIPGATGLSLNTGLLYSTSTSSYYYKAVTTGILCAGSFTTSLRIIVAQPKPPIVVVAAASSVCVGDRIVITETSGTPSVVDVWQRSTDGINFADIQNSDGRSVYSIGTSPSSDPSPYRDRYYRAKLNPHGCNPQQYSNVVHVRIYNPPRPLQIRTRNSATVCSGSSYTITLTGPPSAGTLQWYRKNASNVTELISGATGITLVTPPVINNTSHPEVYTYYAEATHGACTVQSPGTTVITLPATSAGTASISSTGICNGQSVQLNLTGSYGNVIWQISTDGINFTDYSSASSSTSYTTPALTMVGVLPKQYWFRAKVYTNNQCAALLYSNSVSVIVAPPTTITSQPVATPSCPENNFTFTIAATGGNLTYQWQAYDGMGYVDLLGENSSTLITPDFHPVRCVVRGACGATVYSNMVEPVALPFPTIGVSVTPQNVCAGNMVTLSASGSDAMGTITYAWDNDVQNGVSFVATQSQVYTVVATNTVSGCTTTRSIQVNVNPTPAAPVFCISGNGWCEPAAVELCVFPPVPEGTTFKLYDENMNFVSINTTVTPFLQETTTFYSSFVNSTTGCESEKTLTEVHINDMVMNDVIACPGIVDLHDYVVSPIMPAPIVKFYSDAVTEVSPSYNVTANATLYAKAFYMNPLANTLCISDPVPFDIIVSGSCATRVDNSSSSDASETSLTLFPNPANDEVHVNVSGMNSEIRVTILDVNGKEVYSVLTSGNEIVLSDLNFPSGIYMMKVSDGEKVKSVLFTKIK